MNSCIINIVDRMAFIAFPEIIEEGRISIWSTADENSLLVEKHFSHSNFENLDFDFKGGVYRFQIDMNGEQIIKTIKIK